MHLSFIPEWKKKIDLEVEIIYVGGVIHDVYKYGNMMSVYSNWLLRISTAQTTYNAPTETPLQFWHEPQ